MNLRFKAYGVLFLGLIIGFVGLFYTSNILIGFMRYQLTIEKKVAIVQRIESLVSQNQSLRQLPLLSLASHSVDITVTENPIQSAMLLGPNEIAHLDKWFKKHEHVSVFALALPNGGWVNIDFKVNQADNIMRAIFIAIWCALILLMVLLVVSVVRMLLKPLNRLNQLGKSMQADTGNTGFMITPIAEANAIIDAVNALQVRIRSLLSDRTQMLAAISHDLRTPITRLKLRAEAIDDAKLHEKILNDLAEMEHMIDSVLSFIQSDQQEAPVTFDMAVLLETLVDDMQDAGFSVHYEGEQNKLLYTGQMGPLKRALSNLMDNAVKYGQGAIVSLDKNAQELIVTIDDHGPGIPESELKKVFQPFYRLDTTRNTKTGGTGLGLVIVKNIIGMHHGDIKLINLPKGGLRVQVALPLP